MESKSKASVSASAVLNAAVSKVTQIQEDVVNHEIDQYDTIIRKKNNDNHNHSSNDNNDGSNDNDDPIIQQWRMKRIQEYQKQQNEIIKCQQTFGHGEYLELGNGNNTIDIAKDFFNICKQSTRIIIHCYRDTTELCTIFHKHLNLLSQKHIETRFIKFNVQDYDDTNDSTTTSTSKRGSKSNIGIQFLIERLQIRVMPTLICIQDQIVIHRLEGCTELNNNINFSTNMLAYVLGHKYKMLYPTSDEIPDEKILKSNSSSSNTKNQRTTRTTSTFLNGMIGSATRYRYRNDDDEESDDDNYEDF